MNITTLTCPICLQYYDETERQPFQLNVCMHKLCKHCMETINPKKCSFCAKIFSPWKCVPVPWILEVIEELKTLKLIDAEIENDPQFVDALKWSAYSKNWRYKYKDVDVYIIHSDTVPQFRKLAEETKRKILIVTIRGRGSVCYVSQHLNDTEFNVLTQQLTKEQRKEQLKLHQEEIAKTNFPALWNLKKRMLLVSLPKHLSEPSFFDEMFGKQQYWVVHHELLILTNFKIPDTLYKLTFAEVVWTSFLVISYVMNYYESFFSNGITGVFMNIFILYLYFMVYYVILVICFAAFVVILSQFSNKIF